MRQSISHRNNSTHNPETYHTRYHFPAWCHDWTLRVGWARWKGLELAVPFAHLLEEFREREINNGRFAMFAAIGIIAAELYTGKDAIEQFGL